MDVDNHTDFTGDEKPQSFLIVGLGASAGGIQALREFFENVPADSGMAYVVILHLSPDHDSQLTDVLQMVSVIPVSQVAERTKIEPNHIYVMPPAQHLTIENEYLVPSLNLNTEERRAPVDIFFRHLADVHGPRAVCVVLSGTGANGSMGLKRVKEKGGVVYVQNPREAEYNDMPRNAIATELVDEVLPVAQIPPHIISYRDSLGTINIVPEKRPEPQQQALREIFTQLLIRTGHDFTNYKRPTLLRRIERRINLRNLPDLPSYASYLQKNPEESQALLKDLLISVTNFFRDAKPFEAIARDVLPKIFADKTSQDQLRIWVAGCATGEEAYSVAILCAELLLNMVDAPKVQIFATDIDEAAIATAREGFYTVNDTADVSSEQLRYFFNKEGEGFRVRREIREMVLFAHHNFLKDPPFSRLDLISCRNVLIYLNSTAQERVIETFHFALRPRAFLFLGNSESIDGASDLFSTFNRDNHIFQAREVATRNYPVPESVPGFQFPKDTPLQKAEEETVRPTRMSFGDLHQKLLEQYAPPSVVVNEEYEIVHMTEGVGKYFEFTAGEPTQNLLKLVRPEIRLELSSALYQAVQYKTAVDTRNVQLALNENSLSLDIHIRPVLKEADTTGGFILVIFEEGTNTQQESSSVMVASDEPVARRLEEEVNRLKARLRGSAEQHEVQTEELKATNEELQAMNEELRSATEELETSKEELQSINEELRTINQELKIKIEETTTVSNHLQNLINSADVGTIFLDRSFCVRLFTPAVLQIFNLKNADHGRPITDITNKLQFDGLLKDVETVLQKLSVVEREVATTDNHFFMMRVLPYRTAEDRINGTVITFFDVTKRKLAENAHQQSEQYLRLLIEGATDYAIFTLSPDRTVVSWSAGAEAVTGYTEAEVIGRSGDMIFASEDRQAGAPVEEVVKAEREGRAKNERWYVHKNGSRFWGSGSISPLWDADQKLIGFVKIMRDNTSQRQMDEAVRLSEQRLQRMVNIPKVGVLTFNYAGQLLHANDAFLELIDYSREEFAKKNFSWRDFTPPEYVKRSLEILEQLRNTGWAGPYEKEYIRKDGARIWLMFSGADLNDGTIIEYAVDISDRKLVEEARRAAEAKLRLIIESAKGFAIFTTNAAGVVNSWNMGAAEIFGWREEEIIGQDVDILFTPEDRQANQPKIEMDTAKNQGMAPDIRWHLRKDGSSVFINGATHPIYDADGKLNGFVKVGRDVTAQHNAETALRKSEENYRITLEKEVEERTTELKEINTNLQYANENLQQFASIASHDLQEPLRKIKMFASVLKKKWSDALPTDGKDVMNKINASADRMSELIKEVLAYSKIASGPREFVPTDLHTIINNILGDLELLLEETGAEIQYENPLPTIDAIPLQMNQLFYNLVTNALKFRQRETKPVIRIEAVDLAPADVEKFPLLTGQLLYIDVTVSDNGIGFDPQFGEQIFQIFERLHSVDEYEGTGVGLALCKKIVENHRGHIYAVSKEDEGASFHVILPTKQ